VSRRAASGLHVANILIGKRSFHTGRHAVVNLPTGAGHPCPALFSLLQKMKKTPYPTLQHRSPHLLTHPIVRGNPSFKKIPPTKTNTTRSILAMLKNRIY
jgi:hypothetical protein